MIARLTMLATVLLATAKLAPGEITVYVNANVHTMDPDRSRVSTFATENGVFIAVGHENVAMLEGVTRRVDLDGATVLPGLIDAHGHMQGLGEYGLGLLDFATVQDFSEIVDAVEASADAKTRGAWVLGGRWDHESWPGKALPTHHELSEVSPANPVWLRRVDGHAGLANAAAMRLAGIDRATPNPPGGEIIRDADGEPTGVLVDNAMSLVERVIDDASFTAEAAILKAQEMCLAAGLTAVHDMGVSPSDIGVYRRLAADGRLKIRVYAMIHGADAMEWFEANDPIVGDRFTMRGTKLYMDGAMGSRGAWLKAPYSDRPTDDRGRPYTGLAVSDPRDVAEVAADAARKGYQITVHAIGDRGNAEVLGAFRAARVMIPSIETDFRGFRIEHAQMLDLEDVPMMARLGVIASMQPTHCTSDMRWVEERIGAERARGAYAWATLLRAGVPVAFGSDFPVESQNPFLGLYAAITRQNLDGAPEGGWRPEERVARTEALRGFTVGAAFAEYTEGRKGSIERGKLADFVVIDRDVMTCEAEDIPATRVLATVIGGEAVHAAPDMRARFRR
ncbi:MAG: amidohydrolase [Phycisphaerales bacterium]